MLTLLSLDTQSWGPAKLGCARLTKDFTFLELFLKGFSSRICSLQQPQVPAPALSPV